MLLKDIKVAETQGGGSGHFGTFLHKFRQNRSNKVTFVTVAPQGYTVAETQGGESGYFCTFLPKFLQIGLIRSRLSQLRLKDI